MIAENMRWLSLVAVVLVGCVRPVTPVATAPVAKSTPKIVFAPCADATADLLAPGNVCYTVTMESGPESTFGLNIADTVRTSWWMPETKGHTTGKLFLLPVDGDDIVKADRVKVVFTFGGATDRTGPSTNPFKGRSLIRPTNTSSFDIDKPGMFTLLESPLTTVNGKTSPPVQVVFGWAPRGQKLPSQVNPEGSAPLP